MTPTLLRHSPDLAENAAVVLEVAAARIDRDGFVQGRFCDTQTGRFCMSGAITQSAIERFAYDWAGACRPVIDAAVMAVMLHIETTIPAWNDRLGRTKDDVVEALLKTAAEVRSQVVAA